MRLKAIARSIVAACALFAAPAFAQGVPSQLGPVTYGHGSMWVGDGRLMDAGDASNSSLTGTRKVGESWVNSGLGACGYSAYASGAYTSLCWGFDGSGNGLIDIEGMGGGAPSLSIKLNGTSYPFPGAGTGNVVAPTSPAIVTGNLVAGNGGTTVKDTGIGLAPVSGGVATLYVKISGGNDTLNNCQTMLTPCATYGRAVAQAQWLDILGAYVVIHDVDTGAVNDAESVSVTGPIRGGASTAAVPQIGSLWPSQIILDGGNNVTITGAPAGACYGVAASNNAIVGIENITIAPTAAACQDGLFAQLQGGINVFGNVTLGATGSLGCKAHAEDTAYGIEFWQNVTYTGNGNCGDSAGPNGLILRSAGITTITGNPTLSTMVFVSAGGTWQTDIANPFGASPGACSGSGFILAPGGTIEPQGLSVAWPCSGTSYFQGGAYDQAPAPTASADSGAGTGATVVISSGSTPYSGAITLTAGTSPSSTTVITVTMPTNMSVRRPNGAATQCSGQLLSTNFANGANLFGSTLSGGTFTLTIRNSGTALTASQTYPVSYSCPTGSSA